MKVGEKFKTILGTKYEIVEINENEVTCVILSGLYKGGASAFEIEEVKRYLKQTDDRNITTYKVDYEDENFEIIYANNDNEAIEEAEKYETEHGIIFNIFEIDENYEEVRTVL